MTSPSTLRDSLGHTVDARGNPTSGDRPQRCDVPRSLCHVPQPARVERASATVALLDREVVSLRANHLECRRVASLKVHPTRKPVGSRGRGGVGRGARAPTRRSRTGDGACAVDLREPKRPSVARASARTSVVSARNVVSARGPSVRDRPFRRRRCVSDSSGRASTAKISLGAQSRAPRRGIVPFLRDVVQLLALALGMGSGARKGGARPHPAPRAGGPDCAALVRGGASSTGRVAVT